MNIMKICKSILAIVRVIFVNNEVIIVDRLTVKFGDNYILKSCVVINRYGEVDDVDGCIEYCATIHGDCEKCVIQKCFNRLVAYENMQENLENRIKHIKGSSDYPHNFKGQIVKDLEWVLKML